MVGDGDSVNLKDISVTGFNADGETAWDGPSMTRVDSFGYTMLNEADWQFLYNNELGEWGGHWFDNNYGDYIEYEEEDIGPVMFEPGEGLYVIAPAAGAGGKVQIIFSSPIADHDAE